MAAAAVAIALAAVSVAAAAAAAPTCTELSDLVVYTQTGPWTIAPALISDPDGVGCTMHYVSIPSKADPAFGGLRLLPANGSAYTLIRSGGDRFGVLAEFSWKDWEKVWELGTS